MTNGMLSKISYALFGFCLVALFVALFAPSALAQGTPVWQQVKKRTKAQKTANLDGGEGHQMILNIAYAPSNPKTAYFATDTSQVWKSTDEGNSWQRKGDEFPAEGASSVVVDPTNENIVYAAGSAMSYGDAHTSVTVEGILRTTDGGANWKLVKTAHFHKSNVAGEQFAFAGNNIYAAPDTGGILKSTGGTALQRGINWTLLNKSGGGYVLDSLKLYDIKTHPKDITVLFVSTNDGLYKVVDNGVSATVTAKGAMGKGLPSGSVYQIQIDRNNPNVIFAAMGASGVYRSTDAGVNFGPRNNGLSGILSQGGFVRFLVMAPSRPERLLATFQNVFGKSLYHTSDGGAQWIQTETMDEKNAEGWVAGSMFGYTTDIDGITSGYFAPMAFHPSDANVALVSGWGNRIKKTTNGGVSWRYSNNGYTGSVTGKGRVATPIGWDAKNKLRAVYSHGDFGSLLTEDDEDTFKYIATVSHNGRNATAAAAMHGSIIVEAVGQTNVSQQGHILAVSRDSGANWTKINGTDGDRDGNGIIEAGKGERLEDYKFIAFNPKNPSVLYAGRYKFTNIQINDTYTVLSRDVLNMFKGNGDVVYSFGGSTVYKSIDAGTTWTSPYPLLPTGKYITQIAIDPTNENIIYAVSKGNGVYIITDLAQNGGTVQLRNEQHGLTKDAYGWISIDTIATDPNNASVVYAGAFSGGWSGPSNGVFRSTDKGQTWKNINGNLGSYLTVHNVAVNPFNSYVYLSSFAGTWKLPPPGTSNGALSVSANKTLSPVNIDGSLAESVWSLSQTLNKTISGTNNNTATFGVLWDNTYLYVGIKVLDSNLLNDSTDPWQDDSIEVYIDGKHEHSSTYDANDRQYVKGYNDTALLSSQNSNGVLHGTANIAGGYTVEMAIPWSNLGLTPAADMSIGFDVQNNDDDNAGGRDGVKDWNALQDINYTSTVNFGHLVLSATTVGQDTAPAAPTGLRVMQ